MEVLRGVHQIPSPFPGGVPHHTNVYLIEGTQGHIVVDSGWDTQESLWALQEGMKGRQLKLRDITHVIITHIHPDHYGLASKIRQISGAKVGMHQLEADAIVPRYKDYEDLLNNTERELRQNGVPQDELPVLKEASPWMNQYVTPDPPELLLEDGDTIYNGSCELEVIWTPGHTSGHICLFERKRKFILTGDHVLYETTPHIGVNPQSRSNPLGDYVDSLKRLEHLKASFVLPGHGPVFNALGLRIEKILKHHEQRKQHIMKTLHSGTKTAYQIAGEIPWMVDEGGAAFENLGVWDKRMAVTETIAHLRLLMEEDRVANIDMEGASFYLAKD